MSIEKITNTKVRTSIMLIISPPFCYIQKGQSITILVIIWLILIIHNLTKTDNHQMTISVTRKMLVTKNVSSGWGWVTSETDIVRQFSCSTLCSGCTAAKLSESFVFEHTKRRLAASFRNLLHFGCEDVIIRLINQDSPDCPAEEKKQLSSA